MDYIKFFTNYSLEFKTRFPQFYEAFHLKEIHCKNVAVEAVKIGEKLCLTSEELKFCELIGLFHDMGRFPQFAEFKTFNDLISCDHGKKSVLEAIRTNLVFKIEKEKRDVFLSSLFFHNKKKMPEFKQSKKHIKSFFLKILRDADKLDIYRVVCQNYLGTNKNSKIISMNFEDSGEISPKIISDILNHKPASITAVKSLTDLKLSQMSWVFDLNFKFSIEQVKKKQIPEIIFSTITPSKKSEICFKKIMEFLKPF
ncbi:MAG: HD domain-containing protein [Desulforegulaceae bacterium]|nr:HD domain-containing protein [Desulforegulaceae bacterium]